MVNRLLLISFLIGYSVASHAINFFRVNIAWQYDVRSPLRMDHRTIDSGEGIYLYLEIMTTDSLKHWSLDYLVQEGYESESDRPIKPLGIDTLYSRPYKALLRISLPRLPENLLVVRAFHSDEYFYYDVLIRNGNLPFPSFYPVGADHIPVLKNYLTEKVTWKGVDSIYLRKYPETFGPPEPAMGEVKPMVPAIEVDTSYTCNNNPLLDENYFYVVQKDSLDAVSATYLKTPVYFPAYKKLHELVGPLLYILNSQEEKELLSSKNLKSAFDSFWLNTFGSKFNARNAIKKYYDSVEDANRLFTDFKPGWKTDRGMLLIVYGIPDEVYRTQNGEEWYYDEGEAFEFNILSTFFAPRTYSLRRNNKFYDSWYSRVAMIRRGENE